MSDHPARTSADEDQASDVEVDRSALPDGWRSLNWRLTHGGETRREHADLARAHVSEGLAPASAPAFADPLEGVR